MNRETAAYRIIRRTLSSGAHSRDPLADDDSVHVAHYPTDFSIFTNSPCTYLSRTAQITLPVAVETADASSP
jgi:hypothetical protein